MAIPLTINGTTYLYPEPGEDPGWGNEATAWAEAVTEVLNNLVGPGDILQSTFVISNNQTTPISVSGLIFDTSIVRAANVSYSIYRISDDNPSGNSEEGTLFLTYDDSAPVNEKWTLSQRKNGESGVIFSITDTGQIQYQSNDIGSLGYSGVIKFSAKALTQ